MYAIAIGRLLRMLRLRKGWRQSDVAERAGISSSAVGRHENGIIGSLRVFEQHASVFGLRIDVRIVGRAGSLVRLADEEHARIVEIVAAWFRDHGFLTETEASFSEWGERGRIDLLAFDPATGTLVSVEVKTQLLDMQDLFGSLNVKERLAEDRRASWLGCRPTRDGPCSREHGSEPAAGSRASVAVRGLRRPPSHGGRATERGSTHPLGERRGGGRLLAGRPSAGESKTREQSACYLPRPGACAVGCASNRPTGRSPSTGRGLTGGRASPAIASPAAGR